MILQFMALVFSAYVLGSIPFGLILTRVFTGKDLLTTGSGNIGANNVRRAAGSRLAALTLIGDMAKGGVPVYFAQSGMITPLLPLLSLLF